MNVHHGETTPFLYLIFNLVMCDMHFGSLRSNARTRPLSKPNSDLTGWGGRSSI